MNDRPNTGGAAASAVNAAFGAVLVGVAAFLAPIAPRDGQLEGVTPSRVLLWGLALTCALAGVAVILRRRTLSTVNLALVSGVSMALLILAEFVLGAAGQAPERHIVWHVPPLAPGFEPGTERGTYLEAHYARVWKINADGFADPDEFAADAVRNVPRRILLLGDSFAFGARASAQENGIAERLEGLLNDQVPTVVWNTALPGRGQEWEFECLDKFGPILRPQIVIATIFRNDYTDNLYPPDQFYIFEGAGRVMRWERSTDGTLRLLSPEEAYRRAFGPRTPHELLKTTRTFTALDSMLRRMDGDTAESVPAAAILEASAWLERIQARCDAIGARLVVLPIPDWRDSIAPGPVYRVSQGLCESLGLDCVEVISAVVREDYADPPDGHWFDSGHAKGAAALAAHIEKLWPEIETVYDVESDNGRLHDDGP